MTAVAVLVFALIMAALWLFRPASPESVPIPATPDAAAADFVIAYAAGDTPRACQLASASAREKMQSAGWCETSPGWHANGVTLKSYCAVGDDWFYAYRTSGTDLVDASNWITIRVSGIGDKWLVVGVGHTATGQFGDPGPCE